MTSEQLSAWIDRFGGVDAFSARLEEVAEQLRPGQDISAHVDVEQGEIELFRWRTVVEQVTEPLVHVALEEVRRVDPEFMVGDDVGELLDDLLPDVLAKL